MRLHSLRLQNIRSHVDSSIEFGDGVNLFEGDVGSGKSTILLAVEFALFGKSEVRASSLLRHGEREGGVELDFSVKDRRVTARRRLRRSGSGVTTKGCALEMDGKETKLSSNEMKQRVLELLEYGERRNPNAKLDIFTYSVYTPQEDMRTVLTNDKHMREQRKTTLRRALDLEEYELAASNLNEIRLQLDNDAAELRGMASGVDDARGALEEARAGFQERTGSREAAVQALEKARTREEGTAGRLEALQEGETRYQTALSASKDAEAALARAEGELRELSARLEAARDKAQELEGIRSRIGEHSRGLEDLEDLERLEERLQRVQGELKEAMGDLERHRARLQAAEEASARHDELRRALEEAVDPAEDLERVGGEIKALREEAILLDHQVETLRVEEEAIRREDEELTSLEGEAACPKCMQPLTEEHLETLLEANRGRRRDISSRLREKAARKNRLDDEIQEREGTLEELTAFVEERRRMSVELERTREASAELEDLVGRVKAHPALRLEDEVRELEAARDPDRLSTLRRLSGTVEELRAAEERLVQVLDGLPDLERGHEASHRSTREARKGAEDAKEVLSRAAEGRTEGALDEARREHREAVSARSACEADAARAEERLEATRRDVERLEGEVGRMEGIMDRQALHQHVSAWLSDRLIPAVRSMERSIMSMMSEEMDEAAGRWFGLLVDDPDLVLSVDEDFVPSVTHEDFEMDLPALSGGERTAAAFAYRLALNGLVRSNATPDQGNLLILDEPTDGFSREQLSRMGSLFEDLAAEQVVVVSHDRELRAFADRVYVVEKSGGSSSIHQAA